MSLSAGNIAGDNQVVGFQLHDSGLLGLVLDVEAGELVVRLQRVDRRVVVIHLRGVGDAGFDCFRNGAIVFGVFLWNPADASFDKYLAQTAWEVVFGKDVLGERLQEVVADIVKRRDFNHLVLFDCSTYGGYVAALCREIDIEVLSEGGT